MLDGIKLGATQEEQVAYSIFYRLLLAAQNRGIKKPTTIYLNYDEELQSFIMWYALIQGFHIKYISGISYAD
ncbi:hypothetical protein LCGC14_2376710 [marine sediment metagenome]|uniref:Uncharacterized protein n=1 Tax=marine sediment metagenome TaxID=412755 RepID=A0A0F9EWT9_9ZZZZ